MRYKQDCYYYYEYADMGGHIPCCSLYNVLGKCPCEDCKKYLDSLKVMTVPIPKDATNGEVITALFGEDNIYMNITGFGANVCMCLDGIIDFDQEWWEAPYERGRKSADSN